MARFASEGSACEAGFFYDAAFAHTMMMHFQTPQLFSRNVRHEQPIVSGARIASLGPVALGAGSPPTT